MTDAARRREDMFVVRIWREAQPSGAAAWRGCSEHVSSGQRFYFASFADLIDFIRLRLDSDAETSERTRA
jgi:hypothetical protein